jgi:hypothetical protein
MIQYGGGTMKILVMSVAGLIAASGGAFAQDDHDRRLDDLKKEFERATKLLQERFEVERTRLEKDFKAARERLLERKNERREGEKPEGDPRSGSTAELLQRILDRLDHLERRLDQGLPRFEFKEAPFRNLPQFDFRRFEKDLDGLKELAPRLRDLIPELKDQDFRFEFKRKERERKDDGKEDRKEDRKQDRKEDKKGEKQNF